MSIKSGFTRLIEAFEIFSKYSSITHPTYCKDYTLYVLVDPEKVSEEDHHRLLHLGFIRNGTRFCSYTFGAPNEISD